jgi:hypothetical protein
VIKWAGKGCTWIPEVLTGAQTAQHTSDHDADAGAQSLIYVSSSNNKERKKEEEEKDC